MAAGGAPNPARVRHLALLKRSADGRPPHNSTRRHRLENDLENVLVKRFLGEVEARTRSHTQALHGLVRDGASPAGREAFTSVSVGIVIM